MDQVTNDETMEEFGYSICKRHNGEALTFSLSPRGWCIQCEMKEAQGG